MLELLGSTSTNSSFKNFERGGTDSYILHDADKAFHSMQNCPYHVLLYDSVEHINKRDQYTVMKAVESDMILFENKDYRRNEVRDPGNRFFSSYSIGESE